jgi:quercetin dioxygenase-like cupin family protein
MRKLRLGLVLGVLAVVLTVGSALAAFPPQVDPTTVPVGLLASQVRLTDTHVESFARVLHSDGGTNVFVQHLRFAPGQSSGWHTHDGPTIVSVVSGTLTVYDGDAKGCAPRTISAGQGFVDSGFGHVHLARNESSSVPVDLYATSLFPADTSSIPVYVSAPDNCPASVR